MEKNVPVVDVPDNKSLGEWAGDPFPVASQVWSRSYIVLHIEFDRSVRVDACGM